MMPNRTDSGSVGSEEAAWRAHFEADGYVVVRGAWAPAVVGDIRTTAIKAFAAEPWLDPNFVLPAGTDLWDVADRRWARVAELLGHY